MQKSLPRDPRVVRISSALKADRLRTVGGLLSAWCLFDEQTEDGILEGYTPELMDEIIGMPGLAMAMNAVGWLDIEGDCLRVPRFDEHNGQSAKRRAQDVVRKMSARKADKVPQTKQTKSGLEKNREEKSIIPPNPQGGLVLEVEESFKPDHQKIAVGQLLGRRESTQWNTEEIRLLKSLGIIHPDDMALMQDFYGADIPKDDDRRRTTIERLLKHWNGELDKARAYKQSKR